MPHWAHRSYWSRTARAREAAAAIVLSVYEPEPTVTPPNESDTQPNECNSRLNESDSLLNESDSLLNESDSSANESDSSANESDQIRAELIALKAQYDRVCQELQLVKANQTHFNEDATNTYKGSSTMNDHENMTSATGTVQTARDACPPTREDKERKRRKKNRKRNRMKNKKKQKPVDASNQDDEMNITTMEDGMWCRTQ